MRPHTAPTTVLHVKAHPHALSALTAQTLTDRHRMRGDQSKEAIPTRIRHTRWSVNAAKDANYNRLVALKLPRSLAPLTENMTYLVDLLPGHLFAVDKGDDHFLAR